ncbi:MAG: exosortase/archaeosortase family protein [Anaerolineae bacterium]|nr:exosortase/archaeosortase family protein [Anaerolineae bacterium]
MRARRVGIELLAIGLIVFLLGVLTWPALAWLWQAWLSDELYSHGPAIVLVSLFLAWRSLKQGATASVADESPWAWSSLAALLLVLGSLGGLLWAIPSRAFYLALVFCLLLVEGMLWYGRGETVAKKLIFPVAFLGYAIPLPFVDPLSVPLQQWTTAFSTALARLIHIPATYEGSRIMLTTCGLTVGAPCSGLRSLVALLALATLMAYLLQGQWWVRCLLVVLAVPIALIANTGRVLALLVIAERWGQRVALGIWHDWSGLAFFAIAFVLLVALSWGLGCRSVRVDLGL